MPRMPAPLSLKLNVRSLSNADCQGKSRPLNQSVRLDMSHYISLCPYKREQVFPRGFEERTSVNNTYQSPAA